MSKADILPLILEFFILSSLWPRWISRSIYRLKCLNNMLSLKNATLSALFSFKLISENTIPKSYLTIFYLRTPETYLVV